MYYIQTTKFSQLGKYTANIVATMIRNFSQQYSANKQLEH